MGLLSLNYQVRWSTQGLQEAARDSSRASVDHWPFSLMPDSHCKVLVPIWVIRYFWYVLNFLVVRLHKYIWRLIQQDKFPWWNCEVRIKKCDSDVNCPPKMAFINLYVLTCGVCICLFPSSHQHGALSVLVWYENNSICDCNLGSGLPLASIFWLLPIRQFLMSAPFSITALLQMTLLWMLLL